MTRTDLKTKYLGLELSSPIVASASPLTGKVAALTRLEEAGVGAVVLPSLFEEQIETEALLIDQDLGLETGLTAEASGGHFPPARAYNAGPDAYLTLVAEAAEAVDIPVIASLNGTSRGGWTTFASLIEEAGADALELNIYLIAADPDVTGSDIEDQQLRLVEDVRAAVDLPLAVKVSPFFSSPANMARRLFDAGADGLVLFNRFYQPDIDLDSLTVTPNLLLSTSAEMRLVLRWMAILRGRVEGYLAATTGVHTAEDVVKLLLAGADVVMMTSALLENGPDHAAHVLGGVRQWFSSRDYHSIDEGRGSLSQSSVPDPAAFERANYAKALTTYSSDRLRVRSF